MPSPWDYRDDQLAGLIPAGRYYIVLLATTNDTRYEYSRIVGKISSHIKSTRKAYFMPVDQKRERIYFDNYRPALQAMIVIGKDSSCNVPVGCYQLQIHYTATHECVATLPYTVKKEIPNDHFC